MSMWGLKGFKEPKRLCFFYPSLNFVITRAQIAQDATCLSSPCKYCKELKKMKRSYALSSSPSFVLGV